MQEMKDMDEQIENLSEMLRCTPEAHEHTIAFAQKVLDNNGGKGVRISLERKPVTLSSPDLCTVMVQEMEMMIAKVKRLLSETCVVGLGEVRHHPWAYVTAEHAE